MKTSNFIIAFVVIISTSCNIRNRQDNTKGINKENIREYLSESFNINMDTLTTKLVLINYIGCKPCINLYLNYASGLNPDNTDNFMYVVPVSSYDEFSKNLTEKNSSTILIDSLNTIYRKNIHIQGLSVYNIVKGEILEIKTIKLNKISENDLQSFWLKWENEN